MPIKVRKPSHSESAPAPLSGEEKQYRASARLKPAAGRRLEMPDDLRARLESRTGYDMSGVELRESDQPASIGARAYTRGNVIDFAPGQYRPGTPDGEAVIGHEVAHVIQQAHGEVQPDTPASPVNSDPALEHAADRSAAQPAAAPGTAGAPAALPSMSYAAAPVQGLFDGIRRRFRAARQAYRFGKARRAVDEFQGTELAAARGEIASAKAQLTSSSPTQSRMAELEVRSRRDQAASDRWGNLEADSRDQATGDLDPEDMNGFWARMGRGTLFHRKEKEARLAQQADDFRSTAVLDRPGAEELADLQSKRSRAHGAQQSLSMLASQQTQGAMAAFGSNLFDRDGGRQAIGLFQLGSGMEEENQHAYDVATGHIGQKGLTMDAVGSVITRPYLDFMNFDETQYDPNSFDGCVRGFPPVANISKLSMTIGDILKRYEGNGGKLAVFGAMGLGDAQQLYDAFKAKCDRIGPIWRKMKSTLEEYSPK